MTDSAADSYDVLQLCTGRLEPLASYFPAGITCDMINALDGSDIFMAVEPSHRILTLLLLKNIRQHVADHIVRAREAELYGGGGMSKDQKTLRVNQLRIVPKKLEEALTMRSLEKFAAILTEEQKNATTVCLAGMSLTDEDSIGLQKLADAFPGSDVVFDLRNNYISASVQARSMRATLWMIAATRTVLLSGNPAASIDSKTFIQACMDDPRMRQNLIWVPEDRLERRMWQGMLGDRSEPELQAIYDAHRSFYDRVSQ